MEGERGGCVDGLAVASSRSLGWAWVAAVRRRSRGQWRAPECERAVMDLLLGSLRQGNSNLWLGVDFNSNQPSKYKGASTYLVHYLLSSERPVALQWY